jgi:hypothetical protein
MSARYLVIQAPVTFRCVDGSDSGYTVGYLDAAATGETAEDLTARGFQVLLETEDEAAAIALVQEQCAGGVHAAGGLHTAGGTLHAATGKQNGPFVQCAREEDKGL